MEPMIGYMIAVTCVGLVSWRDTGTAKQMITAGKETGFVKGRVTDARGHGIANAEVIIEHTVFYSSCLYGLTDREGYYKIQVPRGIWKASVQFEKQFAGTNYKFDLCPSTTDAFTDSEVATRNFTWKLRGLRHDGNRYYGNKVLVSAGNASVLNLEDVELTLVPEGLLADGSAGSTLIATVTDLGGGEEGVPDVPLGRYIIKASEKSTGKILQVRLKNAGNYGPAVTGLFSNAVRGVTTYQLAIQVIR